MAAFAGIFLFVSATACGPTLPPPTTAVLPKEGTNDAAVVASAEDELFHGLAATDPRLASRLEDSPAVADVEAMLGRLASVGSKGEGQQAIILGSSLDPFAVEARKAETTFLLARFETKTRSVSTTATPAAVAERVLASRMMLAEIARATIEDDLTTYGAELLLAATFVVRDANDETRRATSDAWLAERLGDVNDAFATKKTSVAHRRELADTLDPLERALVDGGGAARFPRSFAVLAKLRETTGEARMLNESPLPAPAPVPLAPQLAVLGEDLKVDALTRDLVAAEVALAVVAKESLAALSDHDGDKARLAAGKRLALRAPCKNVVQGSPVRSLPSSPEREAGCLAVRTLADAKTDLDRAAAWTLIHDRVAVAVWSISFHGGAATLDSARGKASLMSLAEDPTKSALLRRAALRPAVAIGPGLFASLLVHDGKPDPARAAKILAFGEGDMASRRAFVDAAP